LALNGFNFSFANLSGNGERCKTAAGSPPRRSRSAATTPAPTTRNDHRWRRGGAEPDQSRTGTLNLTGVNNFSGSIGATAGKLYVATVPSTSTAWPFPAARSMAFRECRGDYHARRFRTIDVGIGAAGR